MSHCTILFFSRMGGSPELHFGDDVKLSSSPKLYLHLKNNTGITAQYHLSLENFFSKPPTPPSQKRDEEGARPGSARRMLLGRTPNLADPLSKTMSKANAGTCIKYFKIKALYDKNIVED